VGASRVLPDWTESLSWSVAYSKPVGPVRRPAQGWPGVDSLVEASLPDLAAEHLQGPVRT
jgi:hypothetical protein